MKMLTSPHRRRIPALMAAAALVCGLAACGDDDDSSESRPVTTDASGTEVEVTSITVGAVATADHAPLYVADDLGYFDEVGLSDTMTWRSIRSRRDRSVSGEGAVMVPIGGGQQVWAAGVAARATVGSGSVGLEPGPRGAQ